ncbi:MAG: DUF1254 domain-containing protein [Burkholderiales bacterium]
MLQQAARRLGVAVIATAPAGVFGAPAPDAAYRDAFIAFFPLYEMARLRYTAIEDRGNPRRIDLHRFNHLRRLLDHTARNVTAPNNDTLYSSMRIDLSRGPVLIETPRIERRYYSLQFMNAYTDNVAILGRRSAGDGPMRIAVLGPDWGGELPTHTQLVRSDTNDMWLLVRMLVDGPADIAAVAALQDAFRITALQPGTAYAPQQIRPAKDPDAAMFLAVINEFLARNPPQGAMKPRAEAAAAVGIRAGTVDAWNELDAPMRERWLALWPTLNAELRRPSNLYTRLVGGWEFPPAEVGYWGDNLLLRATVALRGIAALDLAETLYLSTFVDIEGQALDGNASYRVRIPAAGLPVRGFWSMTMYEVLPDGRFFLVDNPIRRYSIGNRTPGLVVNADGSLDVLVQPDPPAEAANWLPSPRGSFRLTLRAYLPDTALVEARTPLPRVERIRP